MQNVSGLKLIILVICLRRRQISSCVWGLEFTKEISPRSPFFHPDKCLLRLTKKCSSRHFRFYLIQDALNKIFNNGEVELENLQHSMMDYTYMIFPGRNYVSITAPSVLRNISNGELICKLPISNKTVPEFTFRQNCHSSPFRTIAFRVRSCDTTDGIVLSIFFLSKLCLHFKFLTEILKLKSKLLPQVGITYLKIW